MSNFSPLIDYKSSIFEKSNKIGYYSSLRKQAVDEVQVRACSSIKRMLILSQNAYDDFYRYPNRNISFQKNRCSFLNTYIFLCEFLLIFVCLVLKSH